MEDILPHYLAIGVSRAEFLKACPVEMMPYDIAHRNRLQEQNTMLFWQGRYVADAIMATIGNSPWFKSKSAPLNKYPKEPYPIFGSVSEDMTEDVKRRELDRFFARESVRRANWQRNHKRQE